MNAACAQELPAPAVIPAVGAMKMIVSRKEAKTQRKNRRQLKRSGVFSSWFLLLLCVFASLRETIASPAPRALPPETEAKIRALLDAPELQAGRVGVLISALGTAATPQAFPAAPYDDKTQPVLFALDAEKRFTPASNMKLFTAAMALKVLGPEKTFATTVYGKAPDLPKQGSLWLIGGGDPSFDDEGLQKLAKQVLRSKKVSASGVFADGTLFGGETFERRYPDGWTLDDTLWYYGPEISALAYNRNQLDVEIMGGPKSGDLAQVKATPMQPALGVSGYVKTGGEELRSKSEDDLVKVARMIRNDLDFSMCIFGQVAPRQKIALGIAVPFHELWAAEGLIRQLRLLGSNKLTNYDMQAGYRPRFSLPEDFKDYREIARHESPPLRELMKRLLKNSDNLYAEMILRGAALESLKPQDRTPDTNYAQRGHELIKSWLKENGVATDALKFTDGSGLSRYNLVTPRAVAGVLSAVEKVPGADAFWNALPIAGVDGTMKNRGKGTAMENNARAKSGTFSIVSCLSGYVTTRDNTRLSVVILTNFVPAGTAARRMQDAVFSTLADARF